MEDVIKNYSADFMRLKNTKENDWFSKQRQSAFDIFQESGFPNTRVEDWKYTDVKPIAKNTFSNRHAKLFRFYNKSLSLSLSQNWDLKYFAEKGVYDEGCFASR